MTTQRILWPGLPGPAATTPVRHPGSVRRTSTLDGYRPDGPLGRVILTGRGRDIRTGGDGAAIVLDEAFMRTSVDWTSGRRILSVETVPDLNQAQDLGGI